MKGFGPLHKVYGALGMIQMCWDWAKWFREYFAVPRDGSGDCCRMRSGIDLFTRHDGSDFHVIDEILAFRKYDYFGHRVAADDVVVDIGASIGAFSLYAAAACGVSRVIAFEPFPDNYRLLSDTTTLSTS